MKYAERRGGKHSDESKQIFRERKMAERGRKEGYQLGRETKVLTANKFNESEPIGNAEYRCLDRGTIQ